MQIIETVPAISGYVVPQPLDPLLRAVAAYLSRYKGRSRLHAESDLRAFLRWCEERDLPPLEASRPQLELYLRWMQEVRGLKPSTVSGRLSVISGFYRTCVIDGVLEASPADYVRRPNVPPESPTLGLTHLQFEAMLTAARESDNDNDFALMAMLGLLGLRIFEATGANVEHLGEEHGHRVLRVHGKGDKVVLVPLPPAVARAIDRAVAGRSAGPVLLTRRGTRMDRHSVPVDCIALPRSPGCGCRGCTRTCCDTRSSRPCSTPAWIFVMCRSQRGTRTPVQRCVTTARGRISTAIPTTSWPPTWSPGPDVTSDGRLIMGEG